MIDFVFNQEIIMTFEKTAVPDGEQLANKAQEPAAIPKPILTIPRGDSHEK
jgi:hypothetical protein